jgi:hypothetical protein
MLNEMKNTWKEAAVAQILCPEGLRKTTKNLRIASLRAKI